MRRRGFTLTELLVAMAVLALLGTALARLLLSNSRFVAGQEGQLDARQTARAAMTLMTTDLRMVAEGGVIAADTASVTVRVPYAFGMLCATSGGNTIASLAPADSATYADASAAGVAWRRSDGTYEHVDGITASPSGESAVCAADSIRVVPGGRVVALDSTGIGPAGTLFYLYRTVRYRFGASATLPGRTALFRQVNGGVDQEILAPFAGDAGFRFLVGTALTVQNTPPADLNDLQGLELRLVAESEFAPSGLAGPAEFALWPRVKFVNTAS